MKPLVSLRWMAFALYVVLLFATPPGLLWGLPGLAVGALLGAATLVALRYHGVASVLTALHAKPLSVAQSPALHTLIAEFCRRLRMPIPRVYVIETPGLNVAAVGFSSQDAVLVFTRGLLTQMSRPLMAAVTTRALLRIWSQEVANETWLARFFGALNRLVGMRSVKHTHRTESLALQKVVRQVLLYPLTLFPAFVLKGHEDDGQLDFKAVDICRDPQSLAEAFRRMEAMAERLPYHPPFSCRHLFLSAPPTADPLARVFFSSADFSARVRAVEGRLRPVPT